MACVTSRAFRVAGPSKPASLLPLVDMCNHSGEASARLLPGPRGTMILQALQDLMPAQPVLINYGQQHPRPAILPLCPIPQLVPRYRFMSV